MGYKYLDNDGGLCMKKMMVLSIMLAITCHKAIAADDNVSQQIQLLNSQIQAQLQTLHSDEQKQIQALNKQIQAQLKQIQNDFQAQIKQLQTSISSISKTQLPK